MPANLAVLLGESFSDTSDKLVSSVARHVLQRQLAGDGRQTDCIHPSEASHRYWCPRATYFRITDADADKQYHRLSTSVVFDQGHEAHHKWQRWLWEMGVLRGAWHCISCSNDWIDISPIYCPACGKDDRFIQYREVPVFDPDHLLVGHADGDLADTDQLVEFKTVGEGTIRHEHPRLIKQYSYTHVDEEGNEHKGVDWRSLWFGINRPFPSHRRQGLLYLHCLGRKEMVFVYEPKFLVAQPKEFVLGFDYHLIEEVLEQCSLVKRSLELGRKPKRPHWADPKHQRCSDCDYRVTCYGQKLRGERRGGGTPVSARRTSKARPRTTGASQSRRTAVTVKPRRSPR